MSNILFVNGNLHGHVNPTLPLVKELVERGKTYGILEQILLPSHF